GYEKLAQAKEGPSNQHLASGEASSNGEGDYDMFVDEDDNSKPSTDENNPVSQSSSDAINYGIERVGDFEYDESSGYDSSLPSFCAIIMIQILGFIALQHQDNGTTHSFIIFSCGLSIFMLTSFSLCFAY
ncbi:hypothetical protein V8G54_021330, partial [Vigna mungo]